jgi:trehalose 6-phosphate phosphatase
LKSFFSREGRAALAALPPGRTLFAFDFDGTLAPIVSNPEDAFTLKNLRPVLRRLAKRAPVTVISGRAVSDVEHRLLFPFRYVVGNHGLEGLPEFRAKAAKAKAVCRKWVAQLERDLRELPPGHGIFVEDKKHSLSLHYRHAKNPIKTMAWLSDEIDNLWPEARVIGGKLIFNIVPKGSPHKGTALKALMKRFRCSHAVFVGDDVTDEDAFGEKGRILAIRVGRKKDSLAPFYIRGQNEMPELLNAFLGRLS